MILFSETRSILKKKTSKEKKSFEKARLQNYYYKSKFRDRKMHLGSIDSNFQGLSNATIYRTSSTMISPMRTDNLNLIEQEMLFL